VTNSVLAISSLFHCSEAAATYLERLKLMEWVTTPVSRSSAHHHGVGSRRVRAIPWCSSCDLLVSQNRNFYQNCFQNKSFLPYEWKNKITGSFQMQISLSVAADFLNAAAKQHWHPPGTDSALRLGQRHGNLGVAKHSVGFFGLKYFFFSWKTLPVAAPGPCLAW